MPLPPTVSFDEKTDELVIIDQTRLPGELVLLRLSSLDDICAAISELKVRGAPAIGVAAAVGLYCLASRFEDTREEGFFYSLARHAHFINAVRPTAKNLSWALDEMLSAAGKQRGKGIARIRKALKSKAKQIIKNDIAVCRSIGEYGAELLSDGDTVMTICNAGQLAAVKYGTALSPVYAAAAQGKKIKVFALETRPLLQGARLTAFELSENGVDVTVICDGGAASVLSSGKVSAIFTGCDRVAANGDTANKVGTLSLAVLAKHFGVPFYICAPYSTIDLNCADGGGIEIEERSGNEVREMWYKFPMICENADIFNPAFDVTPAELITGFVTEKGIRRGIEKG